MSRAVFLRGGPADGQIFRVHSPSTTEIRVPVQPPFDQTVYADLPIPAQTFTVARYRPLNLHRAAYERNWYYVP